MTASTEMHSSAAAGRVDLVDLGCYVRAMVTLSLAIDERLARRLREVAEARGVSAEVLAVESLEELVDEAQYLAALEEGIADADAGNLHDAEDVFRDVRAALAALKTP